jgi:integrase
VQAWVEASADLVDQLRQLGELVQLHRQAARIYSRAGPTNKGKRYRAEVLSRAEADALIAACSAASRTGVRNRALSRFCTAGGPGVSEALALRPADVDPERGTVRD